MTKHGNRLRDVFPTEKKCASSLGVSGYPYSSLFLLHLSLLSQHIHFTAKVGMQRWRRLSEVARWYSGNTQERGKPPTRMEMDEGIVARREEEEEEELSLASVRANNATFFLSARSRKTGREVSISYLSSQLIGGSPLLSFFVWEEEEDANAESRRCNSGN